jgi:hypothetical protein
MYLLEQCIENKKKLYFLINNLDIEKYIKLKYDKMYITKNNILELKLNNIVKPIMLYKCYNCNFKIKIEDVFYFSNKVILHP